MATIKQIAELAGVSRGTVDRVLNNRGSVNANTAARVREIAEKLNYKPNKAGLMLAAQKKNLKIGVILFPDSNPFFSEVLEGVNAKAKELSAYNFTVLIRQVPFDETEQFNTMEALLAEGINGLVIAPFNSLYIAAEIDRLTEMNIPVITVNTDILSRRIAYVGSNYRLVRTDCCRTGFSDDIRGNSYWYCNRFVTCTLSLRSYRGFYFNAFRKGRTYSYRGNNRKS